MSHKSHHHMYIMQCLKVNVNATNDGIISVVPVTRAAMVGTRTQNSRGVGCPISSLNGASRLLETGVSVTNIEEL